MASLSLRGAKAMAAMKKPVAKSKAPKTMKAFEKSSFDVEKKGMKEGSKADKALDKKQFAKAKSY